MSKEYFDNLVKHTKDDMRFAAKRSQVFQNLKSLIGDEEKIGAWLVEYNEKLERSPSSMLKEEDDVDILMDYLDYIRASGK